MIEKIKDYYNKIRWFFNFEERAFIRSFSVGTIVQDCRYHPCVITENDGAGDIQVTSLLTGLEGSWCSLYHCGIRKMEPKEVWEYIDIYHKQGDKGIALMNGWTESEYDKFAKEWKTS